MSKVTIKLLVPVHDHDDYDIYKMKEKFDMSANVPTMSVILNHIVEKILSLSDCDNEERLSNYFKKIQLRYLDEDGDFVVIQNDEDLIDAIESILEHNDNPKKTSVKIYIRHSLQYVINASKNPDDILMDNYSKTKTKKKMNDNNNNDNNNSNDSNDSKENKDDINENTFAQFMVMHTINNLSSNENSNKNKNKNGNNMYGNSNRNSRSSRMKERRNFRLGMVGETVYVLLYQKELEPDPSYSGSDDDDETQVLGLFLCEEEAWEGAIDKMLSDLNPLHNSRVADKETREKYYQSAKYIVETNRAKSGDCDGRREAKLVYWIVRKQVVKAFGQGNEPYCWVITRKIESRHN